MLASLDQAQVRLANRSRDPDVQQTGAEMVRAPAERPNALDTAVIYGARRGMKISDLPIVFDLPPSLAVKRTEEFARYVHPVLQVYCARCHNESYDGDFRLVQFKTKLDRTKDAALRANLDATLKLIDRENPPRSELLASSLQPTAVCRTCGRSSRVPMIGVSSTGDLGEQVPGDQRCSGSRSRENQSCGGGR